MFSNYLFPLIHKPTRVTKTSATLIDNILTNSLIYQNKSGVLLTDISDHFPIFHFSITSTKHLPVKKAQKRRIFNKRNMDHFKSMIGDVSWASVLSEPCPETAYLNFMDCFISTFSVCFPLVNCSKKKDLQRDKPWFTKGLKTSSTKKN